MLNNSILNDLSLYGEEFMLGHGKTACLLIHGFCCGPIQMRELAEHLCKWGFTAMGILLPGHCRNTGGLAVNSHHDWKEKVASEYQQLQIHYEQVVVIGFSLGALLTLQLALEHPIERIILMGTPMFMIREYPPTQSLIRLCKNFMKKIKAWKRRCYMESEGYTGYLHQPVDTYFSLQALSGIAEIIQTVDLRLKDVKSPTMVIHSKKDLIAAPASAKYVMKNLGSPHKRLVWLERSHHLMMYDKEKDVVFQAIKEFVTSYG